MWRMTWQVCTRAGHTTLGPSYAVQLSEEIWGVLATSLRYRVRSDRHWMRWTPICPQPYGGEVGDVHAELVGDVAQRQDADHVAPDGLHLVVLAPGTSCTDTPHEWANSARYTMGKQHEVSNQVD